MRELPDVPPNPVLDVGLHVYYGDFLAVRDVDMTVRHTRSPR